MASALPKPSAGTKQSSRISRLPTMRNSSVGQKPTETPLPNGEHRTYSCSNTPLATPAARRHLGYSSGTTPADRKQLNEQAALVVDILRKHFGSDFLPGGLSSISAKQFIATISYFMKHVVGNERGARLKTTKLTIDDVTKYLVELGYATNKKSMSWMKTPNAPHALGKLVDLLQWLCTFLPDTEQHPFDKPENALLDDCLQNAEYVEFFNATLKDSFMLWNDKKKKEFESCKVQLIDKYIDMHVHVHSKAEIESEIETMKSGIEDERKKRAYVVQKGELDELLAKEKHIRVKINELLSSCEEKTAERDKVHSVLHQQEIIVMDMVKQVNQLKKTIAQQSFTRSNIDQKIAKLAKQRDLLETYSDSVNKLKEIGFTNQVKLTWELKRQNELAAQFNIMVHEKFLAIADANWFGLTMSDLTINLEDMYDLRSQIDRISRNFEMMQQKDKCESDCIRQKITHIRLQLQAAQKSYDAEMVNNENAIEKIATLNGQLREVELEIQRIQAEKNNVIEEINGLEVVIHSKKSEKSKLDAQIVQVRTDNNLMMDEYERKAKEFMEIKKEHQNQLLKTMNQLNESIKDLKREMKMKKSK